MSRWALWWQNRARLTVGVALTDTQCVLVVLQQKAGHFSVVLCAEKPLDLRGPLEDILPVEWIKTQLLPFKLKKISLAFHSKNLIVKNMSVPLLNHDKIEAFLKEKMGQYVVFGGADIQVDWCVLGTVVIEGSPQQKILAGALKQEEACGLRDKLAHSGLGMSVLAPSFLALLPLMSPLEPDTVSGLFYMDDTQTKVVLLHKKKPIHVAAFPLGSQHWQQDPSKAAQSFALWFDQEEAVQVEAWYVHASVEQAALIVYIREKTQKETKALCDLSFEQGLALGAAHESPYMTMAPRALGLDKQAWIMKTTLWLVVASGLALGAFFVFFACTVFLEHQIKNTKHDLQELNKHYHSVVEIEKKLTLTKFLIVNRRKLLEEKNQFPWQKFFLELPILMSGHTKLMGLEEKQEGTIVMTGAAMTSEDVFQFLRQLRGYSGLQSADLLEVSQAKQTGWVEFTIQAKKKE